MIDEREELGTSNDGPSVWLRCSKHPTSAAGGGDQAPELASLATEAVVATVAASSAPSALAWAPWEWEAVVKAEMHWLVGRRTMSQWLAPEHCPPDRR